MEENEEECARFSPRRKLLFVAIASFHSFLAPFSSAAVLSAVPNVAAALHTTGTVINYSNAVFLIAMAIAPCFCAPVSQVGVLFLAC